MNVILASASPRRRALLRQVGINPIVKISHVKEVSTAESPEELVRENALLKGRAVSRTTSDQDLVIAADTVVALDGKILGKPHSPDEAAAMLELLSGRTHQVHTGLAIFYKGQEKCLVDTTDVTFAPLSKKMIEGYVASGEPADKAGAYGIQGIAALFIPTIKGSYSNVVGLPLATLFAACNALGVNFYDAVQNQRFSTGGTSPGTSDDTGA
jgi:septum formation protein